MATETKNTDPLSEVEQLTWALVDELITEEQAARLEELLEADAEARKVYLQCIQLHGDLQLQFQASPDEKESEEVNALPASVLSFLQQGLPTIDSSTTDIG